MSEAEQKERFLRLVQQGEYYVRHATTCSPREVKLWQGACVRWLTQNLPKTGHSIKIPLVSPPRDSESKFAKGISRPEVNGVRQLRDAMYKGGELLLLLPEQQEPADAPFPGNLHKALSTRFSNKTIAQLCRALSAVVRTHAQLERLFLEHDLSYGDFIGGIDPRCNALVTGLRQRSDADDALTTLIEYVLERSGPDFGPTERLLRALRLDELEWRDGKLVPTPEPAGLAAQLSQLELDLRELGLNVASEHYRQAYESFVAGNSEAANGQIRSFMEDLLIELGKRQTTKTRSDATAALQDLRDARFFNDSEWQMFRAFWHGIQDRGPHHGLSNEQEALFRLHVATSIARYTVHKFHAPSA